MVALSPISDDPLAATTLPQMVRAAAAAYGAAPAITLTLGDAPPETLSFAELDARSAELARGLVARGVGKGARVGFIVGNGPLFALMLAAVGRIGAVAVPISTMIRAGELVRVLRQSDVGGLVVERTVLGHDLVDRLCDALPDLRNGADADLRLVEAPYLRWILATGGGLPPAIGGLGTLVAAAAGVDAALLGAVEAEVHPTDQLIEIYTSGSMALPKGVRHNHGPVMYRTRYLVGMSGTQRGGQSQAMLPMFWVGGLMMTLLPNWAAGATTRCGDAMLSNSRVAMGSVLADEDLAMMKQTRPYWGLGMSETLGPYSYGDELRVAGYPLCAPMDHFADGFEVRVADEHDRPVADGEVGEMQVRGYPLSAGLHKIERSEYYAPDGFYHTGDMCLVEGARVLFVGRNGDVIKAAGSNVSPGEVEMELQQLDGVHSAYVVGLPDRERGQLVAAALIAREGATLDFNAITAAMRTRLSAYKVPRAYVEIMRDEVPLLHSNKVSRKQMTELVARRLGREATVAQAVGSVS